MRDKNDTVISILIEKAFYKIKLPFYDKNCQLVENNEVTHFHIQMPSMTSSELTSYTLWWKGESFNSKIRNKRVYTLALFLKKKEIDIKLEKK